MIIDLTLTLNQGTPTYPGDPKLKIATTETFEAQGYLGHSVYMGTHAGTHIDAPAHMIKGGKTLERFSSEQFVGAGRYVLVKDGVFNIEDVKAAGIQEGEIVIFNTGMSHKLHDEVYFTDYPAMDVEIAKYLVDCKVKMVGVDACSIDNKPGFPIHKILLGGNVLIVENLTNLEQLQGVKSKIYALPVKLDLDGAPARVIAEVRQ